MKGFEEGLEEKSIKGINSRIERLVASLPWLTSSRTSYMYGVRRRKDGRWQMAGVIVIPSFQLADISPTAHKTPYILTTHSLHTTLSIPSPSLLQISIKFKPEQTHHVVPSYFRLQE